MEEFAIYRDYFKAFDYQREQRTDYLSRLRNADNETLEGYIIFGGGAEEKTFEPESELPF